MLAILPPKLCRIIIQRIVFRFNLKFDYKTKKHVVLENMRRVFPDDPELGWKAELNLVCEILLDAATWKFLLSGSAKRKKFIKIEGREHLEQALKKGKGALLLIAHTGSFVSSFRGLGIHGIPLGILGCQADKISPDSQ